jgi:predicted permease
VAEGLAALRRDLLYAGRTLGARPGFTLVSVIVLATGIGAATVMFSTLDSVLLRQLPYENPHRLVSIRSTTPMGDTNSTSAVDYLDYRERNKTLEAMAAMLLFSPGRVITGGDEPARVSSTMVSANFFPMLGVELAVGRAFTAEEETAGGPDVVVLGHAYWQRHFDTDASVVGDTLVIDGAPHEIVGVVPIDFWHPRRVEMWFPMRVGDGWTSGRSNNNFVMTGRLAEGVSLEETQAEMDGLAAQLAEEYPEEKRGWGLQVEPMRQTFFGDTVPAMFTLSLAVGLFLVIACANLSSLVLARVTSRRSEIAVRAALGASRAAIVRQLLAESVLVAMGGAAVGLFMAWFGIAAIRVFAPMNLPRLDAIAIDGRVLVFTAAVTVASGLLFGLLPALHSTKAGLGQPLREGGARGAAPGSLRARHALVVTQIALSLTLLVGSGLLVRSFLHLTEVDPGFDPAGVITVDLQPPLFRYETGEALEQFFSGALEKISTLPGVEAASGTTYLPLAGGPWNDVHVAGEPPADASELRAALRRRVMEGYFETMRIPLLAGRAFERADADGSPRVAVISRRLADEFFPAGDALGNTLVLPNWGENGLPLGVIGIVGDVTDYGLGGEPVPVFYMPLRQQPAGSMRLAVRTGGDAAAAIMGVRGAIWEIDGDVPLSNVTLMETRLADSTSEDRFQATLLGTFAGVALLMSSMGLYGVLAFFVSQRTREVGIRMALGASSSDVMAAVVRRGMLLAAAGLGLGLLGGVGASYFLESMLFGTAALDPVTYGIVTAVLAVAALGACIVPARRALRVDPVEALRAG